MSISLGFDVFVVVFLVLVVLTIAMGVPALIALLLAVGVMFILAVAVERVVLRPLVNQPDIILFMATFGPVGSDGYPKLLYDKWTGDIDREVAEYWREHYDLRHILERDWKTLGPKLVGKLHFYMGDADTYYLEEATFLMQKFLEGTTDPHYDGSFDIGRRQPHCYSVTPEYPGQRAEQRVFPKMLERILATAPPGADTKSWRY